MDPSGGGEMRTSPWPFATPPPPGMRPPMPASTALPGATPRGGPPPGAGEDPADAGDDVRAGGDAEVGDGGPALERAAIAEVLLGRRGQAQHAAAGQEEVVPLVELEGQAAGADGVGLVRGGQ